MNHDASPNIVVDVRNYLNYLQRLGITELSLRPTTKPQGSTLTEPKEPHASISQLAQLAASVRDCQRCRLHQGRTQVVFGTGDPNADLVFVGEAPGHDEDLQGEPFVGAAGQLLTRIIEAMQLTRDQVYILNVVKCRPPNNRNPRPDEVAACRPILQAQLDCLRPRVICALGAFAAQTLLQTDERISRLRGHFHNMGEIPVMPTYHPAYLLRNPQGKRAVWEDMQQILRLLGLR
ncbi:MAG: uracil-DNA glycosylase [bacterium]|nr:uracil-DNA glycosylase [bacterium]